MHINLLKLRRHFGYSQGYLAKQIGVSRPTYIQVEKGERELTVSEARKLATLFDMDLIDFLDGKLISEPKVVLRKQKKSRRRQDLKIKVPADKVQKFKEVLLYILGKVGAQPNIGETTLYKLLYFIDFDYFERYGEKLIGATYIKNRYGPTPVEFKKVVESMIKEGELEKIKSRYFQYRQKKYLPLRKPDLGLLTAREMKLIDKTLSNLSEKNAKQLSEYSHGDVPWQISKEGKIIDYECVFWREEPYTCCDYYYEAQMAALEDVENFLEPLSKEEIEYYERIAKENEKKYRMR